MEHLLWQSTTKPIRYFLVPVETEVSSGGFEIENTEGEKYSVDLGGIINYEISENHADQLMEKELKALLSDFGSVLKGLTRVGKHIAAKDLFEDDSDEDSSEYDSDYDSEDYDSDEDSSEYDSDYDSEDDSDDDLDDLDDKALEGILNTLLAELEGPLNELKGTIDSEFDALEKELEALGGTLEDEAGDGDPSSFLRELGHRLLRLADEGFEAEDSDDEADSDDIASFLADSEEEESEDEAVLLQLVSDVKPEEPVQEETVEEPSEKSEEPAEEIAEEAVEEKTLLSNLGSLMEEEQAEQSEPEIPSKTELNKMKKAELLDLATSLSLEFSSKSTKKDIIEGIESCR